jgi:hypothetical protein
VDPALYLALRLSTPGSEIPDTREGAEWIEHMVSLRCSANTADTTFEHDPEVIVMVIVTVFVEVFVEMSRRWHSTGG